MTDILIARKRWLPDNCPNCGQEAYRWDGTLDGAFKAHFEGFYAYPVEVWRGVIQWRARCEACPGGTRDRMLEQLRSGESWLNLIPKPKKEWSGGTLAIPFICEPPKPVQGARQALFIRRSEGR